MASFALVPKGQSSCTLEGLPELQLTKLNTSYSLIRKPHRRHNKPLGLLDGCQRLQDGEGAINHPAEPNNQSQNNNSQLEMLKTCQFRMGQDLVFWVQRITSIKISSCLCNVGMSMPMYSEQVTVVPRNTTAGLCFPSIHPVKKNRAEKGKRPTSLVEYVD